MPAEVLVDSWLSQKTEVVSMDQAAVGFSNQSSKPKITWFVGGRLPCPIAIIFCDAS